MFPVLLVWSRLSALARYPLEKMRYAIPEYFEVGDLSTEFHCFYLIRLFVMNFITKLAHIAEGVMQPIQKGHEMFAIHVHSPRFIPVQLSPRGLIEEHLMIGVNSWVLAPSKQHAVTEMSA